MNDLPFKNLATAREEYIKLAQERDSIKSAVAQVELLDTENSELKIRLENATKSLAENTEKLSSLGVLLSEKDAQLERITAEKDLFQAKCTDLERLQKSVRVQARELVAASAGPPAAVDNSEMELTQDDLTRAMRAETDTKRLNALYRQYKAQQEKEKTRK